MSRSRVRGAVVLLSVTASAAACVSATNVPSESADGSFDFDASGFDGNLNEIDSALLRDSSVAADSTTFDATIDDSATPDSTTTDSGNDSAAAIDSAPDGTAIDSGTPVDANEASVDAADAAVPGAVTTISGLQLSTFRQGHNATLLPDGRVIFCGGYFGSSGSIASCDVFDPTTNKMSLGPAMNVGRQGQMATLLPSGQLLLAGGAGPLSDGGFNTLQSAEILDPAATSFTLVSNPMAQARSGAAVLLAGAPNAGKVLLIGGYGDGTIDSGTPNDLALGTTELFDPGDASTHGTFTLSAPLSVRRGSLVAAPLPNGGAIAAGGSYGPGGGPYTYLDTAETIGPGIDGGFTATVNAMSSKRQGPQLTMLLDGRVFILGGYGPTGYAATADIFDPTTRSFTSVTLPAPRGYPALATLKSGRVLIAGGVVANVNSGDVVIYDPATGVFLTATGTLSPARSLASATTLKDGRVIIAGGQGALGIVPSVDIFTEQ